MQTSRGDFVAGTIEQRGPGFALSHFYWAWIPEAPLEPGIYTASLQGARLEPTTQTFMVE